MVKKEPPYFNTFQQRLELCNPSGKMHTKRAHKQLNIHIQVQEVIIEPTTVALISKVVGLTLKRNTTSIQRSPNSAGLSSNGRSIALNCVPIAQKCLNHLPLPLDWLCSSLQTGQCLLQLQGCNLLRILSRRSVHKWLQEATIHMPKNWSKPQPKASHYSSTLNIYVVLYGCQPSVHYSGICIRIGNISLEVMEGNPPVPAISRPPGLESFSELSQRKSSRRVGFLPGRTDSMS